MVAVVAFAVTASFVLRVVVVVAGSVTGVTTVSCVSYLLGGVAVSSMASVPELVWLSVTTVLSTSGMMSSASGGATRNWSIGCAHLSC